MAGDNHGASSLFRRAEQLKRWKDSETNKQEISDKPRNKTVTFSDECIFLAAAAAGDRDELKRLLDRGADINTVNQDGITALHAACIDNNFSIVEFLVDAGADINRSDMEGWTPLHATASCGSLTIAKFLLDRGADLSLVNNDGELAIDVVDEPAMAQLLQEEMTARGVDGNVARSREERCMLEDVNQWIHDGKLEDQPHPKTGATALHVAAAKGYIKVMRLLLSSGANVNCVDYDGWTPLHAAVYWRQSEAVELLCESMADMDATNVVGQIPADLDVDNTMRSLLDELRRRQTQQRHNKKRKTSPAREPSKRKESHTHSKDSDSRAKENNTENGKIQCSPDVSEIQSWRRPSSLKGRNNKVDSIEFDPEPVSTDQTSSNHRKDDTPTEEISSSRSYNSVSRVSSTANTPVQDTTNNSSSINSLSSQNTSTSPVSSPTTTTTINNNNNNTTTATTTSSSTPQPNKVSGSEGLFKTTSAAPPPPPSSPPIIVSLSSKQSSIAPPPPPSTPPSTSNGESFASRISPSSVIKNFFKSFVPPSRDDESETQRKANARLIRSSRRSTQGVSLEDLKTAENLYTKPTEVPDKSKVTTSNSNDINDASAGPPNTETKKTDEEERRPSWRLKVDDNDKNRFSLEDVRNKDAALASTNGVHIRSKPGDDKRDEDVGGRSSSSSTTSGHSREGSQAAIQRRKKPKRRSTGVVHVDMDEIDPEKKAQKQHQEQPHNSTDDSLESNVSDSSSGQSRALCQSPEGEIDYKKLYEKQLAENEHLMERLKCCDRDLRGAREAAEIAARMSSNKLATAESDRREKRSLERKLSEMEEELRVLEQLRQENQKLRDENGALIRVISRLSR